MIHQYRVLVEYDRLVTIGVCTDNSSTDWSALTSGYNGRDNTGYTDCVMRGNVISSAHHVFNYATSWKQVVALRIRENITDAASIYEVNLKGESGDFIPLRRVRAVTSSGANYACGYRAPVYISGQVGTISANSNTLKIVTDQEYVGNIYHNNNRPINFRENGMAIKQVYSLVHGNIQAYPELDHCLTTAPFLAKNACRWVHISCKTGTSVDTHDNTYTTKTLNARNPSSTPSWNGAYLWFISNEIATTDVTDSTVGNPWEIDSDYSVDAKEIKGYVWPKSQCVEADL